MKKLKTYYKKTKKYKSKKNKNKNKTKTKSKKYKKRKKKKYGGAIPITKYKANKVVVSDPPIACNESCNSSAFSEEFNKIHREYRDLLKKGRLNMLQMEQENFIDLFSELAVNTGSYTFYKTKLQLYSENFKDEHGRQLEIPQKEDIPSLIEKICNITGKEICVLIGFAEMLAIFGIYFYEQLRQLDLETMSKDQINVFVRNTLKYVVSSMDENKWSAILNQYIIIDSFNDIPTINIEPWHLKNSALCLFMPDKIHEDNERVINWDKALKITKCRVTREEICLIAVHKNLDVNYIEVTRDLHLYVFTRN